MKRDRGEKENSEEERTKGRGQSCLNVGSEAAEARKADLANAVTLKQEVQVAACHPGKLHSTSRGSQVLSLEGDNCPTLGTM